MEEPSILDYIKSRLNPAKYPLVEMEVAPLADGETPDSPEALPTPSEPAPRWSMPPLPWRSLLALVIALVAQRTLEPPTDDAHSVAIFLYGVAALLLVWAYFVSEWRLPSLPEDIPALDDGSFHLKAFVGSIILSAVAFIFFGGNLFTPFNLTLWFGSLALYLYGLWFFDPVAPSLWSRFREFLRRPYWNISVTRWLLLLLVVWGVVIFFRVYNITGTPLEPFSDHAEKLLDVYDVTQGQTRIFFPRNTGREAIQMYLTAFVAWLFGTGISFLSLKLGTALAGIFTLPYVYLLGKELANRRVALLALLMAGMAYWPNVISRVGLRFPLYPLFAAPVLYYLLRGLRTQHRNDFILAGLFLGAGLHGYSTYRFMPFVVVAAFLVYFLHTRSAEIRKQAFSMLAIVAFTSLLVFSPLLRYTMEDPNWVAYRSLTRLGTIERDYPGNPGMIFLDNLKNSMLMMNVDDGEAWVHAIPYRPALDVVSAALFAIGYFLLFIRYLHHRRWQDLFLLLSVPLLMMPSILSLAFPNENPSLNRSGAAMITVFIIVAMAMDGLYSALKKIGSARIWEGVAVGVLGLLVIWAGVQNYHLVFDTYSTQFRLNAWNTSDMGRIIQSFEASGNPSDNAWVIPYPYWVDTRLVAIWAGDPTRDMALCPPDDVSACYNAIQGTLSIPGDKLFIVKPEDGASLQLLEDAYPIYSLNLYQSGLPGKDFWVMFVPAQ